MSAFACVCAIGACLRKLKPEPVMGDVCVCVCVCVYIHRQLRMRMHIYISSHIPSTSTPDKSETLEKQGRRVCPRGISWGRNHHIFRNHGVCDVLCAWHVVTWCVMHI